ncbi:uncharacterized protein C8Q71DRAFT_130236 [Rhodofomes roseus]|uniref:Uncharacterized protein n=1 Tax=Rhodofomes roseus TaxID=34475 RepID=A0ABQ8KBT8_9APHY|nr:uncharacterized protein C8Q71DRAFT_130236 [Rhodofomes roseus]KAH9834897.1 hypothetical protein C8Q71DRAFT_130236 [Rhodofomes roseus]
MLRRPTTHLRDDHGSEPPTSRQTSDRIPFRVCSRPHRHHWHDRPGRIGGARCTLGMYGIEEYGVVCRTGGGTALLRDVEDFGSCSVPRILCRNRLTRLCCGLLIFTSRSDLLNPARHFAAHEARPPAVHVRVLLSVPGDPLDAQAMFARNTGDGNTPARSLQLIYSPRTSPSTFAYTHPHLLLIRAVDATVAQTPSSVHLTQESTCRISVGRRGCPASYYHSRAKCMD